MTSHNMPHIIQVAKDTIHTEQLAIGRLSDRLDKNFEAAVEKILHCKGKVIVLGMGKSGHIGRKIAATLASTGTPAFFVHPAEASHGDMGMISSEDIVLCISNSGNTGEVITLIPYIKSLNTCIIAMTGNLASNLSRMSNIVLDISIEKEACPHDLAPTASTTVTLVMGDALSMALLSARGFTVENFAHSHPGGSLGKRLSLSIDQIMHQLSETPSIQANQTAIQALEQMQIYNLGMVVVLEERKVAGIITDGDIRRYILKDTSFSTITAADIMHSHPITITLDLSPIDALQLMENNNITSLIIVKDNLDLQGVVHMHDLLRPSV